MKLLLFGSGLLLALLGSLLGFLAGNGAYPRDPTGTLKRVQHGTLRVGYTQAPLWVTPGSDGLQGIEPALVRILAQDLGARVEWVPGTEQHLFEALKEHELDLLIASTTDESPWKEEVGLTRPYVQTTVYVGVAPGAPVGADLKGQTIAVPLGTDMGHYVREQYATHRAHLPGGAPLVAGYEWQLQSWGYRGVVLLLLPSYCAHSAQLAA
jgi:ABC-type amino acid transport substrate-binding protein